MRLSLVEGMYGGSPMGFRVEGGRYAQVGGDLRGDETGGWLLPGFVDCHCHILPTGLDLLKLHLGSCASHDNVLTSVQEFERTLEPERWLMAVHYDQTKFPDCEHLTRWQLDSVVSDRPVVLRHSNGHASVANTAALVAAGIGESTQDPEGGEFVRDASGQMTGVLLEKAHEAVTGCSPEPDEDEMVEAILRATDRMSEFGITSAMDMMTGRWNLERELRAYTRASESGCKVRLRLCLQWGTVLGPRGMDAGLLSELQDSMRDEKCKVWGLKVFADGAIGSATAAIHGRFLTTGGNGQLIYTPENLRAIVGKIDSAGHRVAVHTIGDRSTDLVMDSIAETSDPSRHRIEHAMILSDAQIGRMAGLGCKLTMQPEFLKRFGHAYRAQLAPEMASGLKRFRSVVDAGIKVGFSSDAPIVPGDPWDGIECAVERPGGFDPAESLTLKEAIEAYTTHAAGVCEDPDQGTFEVGGLADYQVYESEPGVGSAPKEVYLGGVRVT